MSRPLAHERIRERFRLVVKALALSFAALSATSCGAAPDPGGAVASQPQAPRPSPRPTVATPTPTSTPLHGSGADRFGRLEPAAERLFGFPRPAMARLLSENPGATFFELAAPAQKLEEFFAHRRFSVIKQPRGYKVLHNAQTREDLAALGASDPGDAELHIYPAATNRFALRYFGPKNTRPVGNASAAPAPAAPAAALALPEPTPSKESTSVNRVRRTRRTSPLPFNPSEPSSRGTVAPKATIDDWKRENPGKRFLD